MKNILFALLGLTALYSSNRLNAQCANSILNWDNLKFFPSAGIGTYTTLAQSQTQNFALGTQRVTITHNYAAGSALGENNGQTVAIAGFPDGQDLQFLGDGVITVAFSSAVSNITFALHDIDGGQQVQFAATNGATAQNIALTTFAGSVLTISNNNSSTARVNATVNTDAPGNATTGSVSVAIAGPVTSLSITVTATGAGGCNNAGKSCSETNGAYWLTDINACATGSFPTGYHQSAYLRPFTGMPDYVITTPDNNSAYMLDPATGRAKFLFQDAANTFINSFAYDGQNRLLYYVSEKSTADATIKTLKRYDFNTNTISVIGDVTTLYGIPTFDQGVQSSGACFYDGALYLGIEGGTDSKSIVWKINLQTSPVQVSQVYAMNNNSGTTSVHDWGDFVIKNGVLYDFNTARAGTSPSFTYTNSSFVHYNMLSGAVTTYTNPASATAFVGQAALTWSGDMYSIRDVVEKYNENGTKGTATAAITATGGAAWVGNAGDASEAFRPRMDFGDAPADYDTDPLSPAVHELDAALRLGASEDVEWNKTVSANADADGGDEDGLVSANVTANASSYQAQVTAFNNTGSAATLIAWLDYNQNKIFEASEAITVSVASNASTQTINLNWTGLPSTLANLSRTMLRVRITSATNGMTTARPSGYFANGEVEDHQVTINKTVLAADDVLLRAQVLQGSSVQLRWQGVVDKWERFVVQRSTGSGGWEQLTTVEKTADNDYRYTDLKPAGSRVQYRLLLVGGTGPDKYSNTATVQLLAGEAAMRLMPVPVVAGAVLYVRAEANEQATYHCFNNAGSLVQSAVLSLRKGTNEIPLQQLASLRAGWYVLVLHGRNGNRQVSFLKQ